MGTTAARAESPAAVSQSERLSLAAQDYEQYFKGKPIQDLKRLADSHSLVLDMVLEMHSTTELAAEALERGLDQRPDVASQLADYKRQILAAALLHDVRNAVEIPNLEALARERYRERRQDFATPETRRVAHILLRFEKGGLPEDALFEKANDLRKRIVAGESFEDLAREFSADATAAAGGVLPTPVARDGRLVKPFEDAAMALSEVGQISQPVRTQFGIHLIKLLEVRPSKQLDFDEIKVTLMDQLEQELRNSAMQRKRGEAYPDPTTINFKVLEDLVAARMAELRTEGVRGDAAN